MYIMNIVMSGVTAKPVPSPALKYSDWMSES